MMFFACCLSLLPSGPLFPQETTSLHPSSSLISNCPAKTAFLLFSWLSSGTFKVFKSLFIDFGTERNDGQHCQRQPFEVAWENSARINEAEGDEYLFFYLYIFESALWMFPHALLSLVSFLVFHKAIPRCRLPRFLAWCACCCCSFINGRTAMKCNLASVAAACGNEWSRSLHSVQSKTKTHSWC